MIRLIVRDMNRLAWQSGTAPTSRYRVIRERCDGSTYYLGRLEARHNGEWHNHGEDVIGTNYRQAVRYLRAARQQQKDTRARMEQMIRLFQRLDEQATTKGETE
jgi:hypothetical protein